jgi:hypothetical protein
MNLVKSLMSRECTAAYRVFRGRGGRARGRDLMGMWFWLNIPLALLFVCCWTGIPLWHVLHRWNDEIKAKHAELAARAVPVPVIAQRVPDETATRNAGSPVYPEVVSPPGR